MDMVHLPSFLQSHVVVGRNCVNHLPIDLVMPGQCQTLFDDCPGVFGSVGTVEMFVTGEDRLFDVGLQLFIHVFRKKSPFHGRGKGLWL
jgi:hypothetical protein